MTARRAVEEETLEPEIAAIVEAIACALAAEHHAASIAAKDQKGNDEPTDRMAR